MELTLDRLTKQYGEKLAVDRLEETLHEGVYGLLGANGAGKTTLMRMICDILKASSGEVLYNQCNIRQMGEEYRSVLGYLPQHFGYYPEFTGQRFMMYMASLKGIPKGYAKTRTAELLELVGLNEVQHKKIKTYSGGMKQRLGIAQAMLNDPQILVLDEPTAGLDPKERVRFRNLISSFSKNKIVLLSTHIVSDVEFIADEILVMKNGQFLHRGKPQQIIRQVECCVWECEVEAKEAERYLEQYNIANLRNCGDKTVLRIISNKKPMEQAKMTDPTLEDLYLYYFDEEGR